MAQARFYSSVAVKTTLNGSITAGATTLVVTAATGFPASVPFTLILERDTANEEVVTVTAVSSLTLTVARAQDGTTGVSHATGAVVEHGASARDFSEPQAHIAATGAVHGLTGSIVGTADAQTLTNKTLTSPVISTISNTGTLTLPTSTDTLVGRATTDTLTNKTLTGATLTGAALDAPSTVGGVSGTSLSTPVTYTPAWSQTNSISLSTNTGWYQKIGKLVVGQAHMVSSVTDATGGACLTNLPFAPVDGTDSYQAIGTALINDLSATTTYAGVLVPFGDGSTLVEFRRNNATHDAPFGHDAASTEFYAVGAGDTFTINFSYIAA